MPRLAPQVETGMEIGEVDDALKSAKKVLDAAATAKLLEGVKNVATGNGSSIKDVGEVVTAAAESMRSTTELQTSLIKQMADMVQKNMSTEDGELKSMMNRLMLMKMIESLGQNSSKGLTPEWEKLMEFLREENQRLKEEIRELKQSRSDPISEQMQALTVQILSQQISNAMNPFQGLRELARAREELADLLRTSEVPPEYSEGALKLKALEKELKALDIQENIKLREMEQKERIYSQQIPALIAQAGTVLANVLSSFGLAPTRPLTFDKEAENEASKMAGEQN